MVCLGATPCPRSGRSHPAALRANRRPCRFPREPAGGEPPRWLVVPRRPNRARLRLASGPISACLRPPARHALRLRGEEPLPTPLSSPRNTAPRRVEARPSRHRVTVLPRSSRSSGGVRGPARAHHRSMGLLRRAGADGGVIILDPLTPRASSIVDSKVRSPRLITAPGAQDTLWLLSLRAYRCLRAVMASPPFSSGSSLRVRATALDYSLLWSIRC